MKIMILADEPEPILWDYLDKSRLTGIDLILSCGDLPAEYLSFLTCFTHAPILYVRGNHDGKYEEQPPEGCICAEDTVCKVGGLRILGLGGCMRYNNGADQYSEREMRWRVLKLYPRILMNGGFDILLTHAPAQGIGDGEDLCHRGFEVFLRLIDRFHPKLMAHGHVHRQYTFNFIRERSRGTTRIINGCGSCVVEI